MWSITIRTRYTEEVKVYSESQEKLNDIVEVVARMFDNSEWTVVWEDPTETNLPIILE